MDESQKVTDRVPPHEHRWGRAVLDQRYPDHPGGEVRHYYRICRDCRGRQMRISQRSGRRFVILHDWFANV